LYLEDEARLGLIRCESKRAADGCTIGRVRRLLKWIIVTVGITALVRWFRRRGTEAEVIASPPPRPAAKDATRPDFKVGDRVTFHDRDNIPVTGTVSRINKKTVTVAPDNNDGHWRVSAALLNHLVDI